VSNTVVPGLKGRGAEWRGLKEGVEKAAQNPLLLMAGTISRALREVGAGVRLD